MKKKCLRQKGDSFQAWGKIKMLEIYLIKQVCIFFLVDFINLKLKLFPNYFQDEFSIK